MNDENQDKMKVPFYYLDNDYHLVNPKKGIDPSTNPITAEGILELIIERTSGEDMAEALSAILYDWNSTNFADDTDTRAGINYSVNMLIAFCKDLSNYESLQKQVKISA